MEQGKRNKICIIVCVTIILIGIIVIYFLVNLQNSNTYEENQIDYSQNNVQASLEEGIKKNSISKENESAITAVLDEIKNEVNIPEYVLKDLAGDVTAEHLSEKEYISNIPEYVDKLASNMSLFKIYTENGNQYVEYETIKVLNALGYSTHMGGGIVPGIKSINLSGNNVVSNRMAIQKVLSNIKEEVNISECVLKALDGDVTAEHLSELEYKSDMPEYVDKLASNMNIFKIYTENGNQYVEYETIKVLNALGYSTHMGGGIVPGIKSINLSGNNVVSNRMAIQKVLSNIKEEVNISECVLKALDGDVTAEHLSELEYKSDMPEYVDKLASNMNIFKIYTENGNQYVEYETSEVLNALGYSTHMGVGIPQGSSIVKLSK